MRKKRKNICTSVTVLKRRSDRMKGNLSHVQNLRKAIGITQQELADKTGINIRQIQKYEYGEYDTGKMMLRNAIALADALGCDVRELIR